MKIVALAVALGGVMTLHAAPASAQFAHPQQPARGAYGGGFIEMLMGGPASPRPDPFQSEPRDRRMASLPVSPDAEFAYRAPDPIYRRQVVGYDGPDAPGTIVIDTPSRFLYHVQPGGSAVRYGIGVGRPGFAWAGNKTVTMKREWPDWTPPAQMLARRPDLPRHMEGGPGNPLGARALYLGSSLYRIHGTNEPHTIGQNVSSGCIRMMNEDVIDLYGKVAVGTRVKVI